MIIIGGNNGDHLEPASNPRRHLPLRQSLKRTTTPTTTAPANPLNTRIEQRVSIYGLERAT